MKKKKKLEESSGLFDNIKNMATGIINRVGQVEKGIKNPRLAERTKNSVETGEQQFDIELERIKLAIKDFTNKMKVYTTSRIEGIENDIEAVIWNARLSCVFILASANLTILQIFGPHNIVSNSIFTIISYLLTQSPTLAGLYGLFATTSVWGARRLGLISDSRRRIGDRRRRRRDNIRRIGDAGAGAGGPVDRDDSSDDSSEEEFGPDMPPSPTYSESSTPPVSPTPTMPGVFRGGKRNGKKNKSRKSTKSRKQKKSRKSTKPRKHKKSRKSTKPRKTRKQKRSRKQKKTRKPRKTRKSTKSRK